MKRLLIHSLIFFFTFFNIQLQAQDYTQTIRGAVIDMDSKSLLIGANIILSGSDPLVGTISDINGEFRLEKVPVGRQNLKISYLGYENVYLNNIIVNTGKEVVLTIKMKEKVFTSEVVEIVYERDKTKANKIKDNFEKEIEKLEKKSETYDKMIKRLRDKRIPLALKNKLEDERFGKEHAFENMKHNHTTNTRLTIRNCDRCKFNQREIEWENLIDSLDGNEKTVVKIQGQPNIDKALQKLKIFRGRFDDVIGFGWSWG